MAEIIFGSDSNPGGRKYNEDRYGADSFTTQGGLNLAVAVVCDGVGGEERGERAAQLAVDTFLTYLRSSDITDPPRLLNAAVKAANLAAYNEAQRLDAGERMACTLVAAMIQEGETLYIANVGDSRIYLAREGQLQQLSRDHTFANVMVWMGKLSPEAAAANPDASKVMRVLGTKPDIQVDLGIYLHTTDYGDANKIGRAGSKLQTGDSILLCSDGLVKDTATTGQPLVFDKEIVQVLQTDEGPQAARAIMGIALGRIPVGEAVDNITLALLQTEDPSRAANAARLKKQEEQKQQREMRRKMAVIAALVGIPACVVLIALVAVMIFGYQMFTENLGGTATQLAQATLDSAGRTQTVAAFTPTPSATPTETVAPPTTVPTLAPGEIAKLYQQQTFLEALFDDRKLINVPPNETRFIAVNHRGQDENGNLYLLGDTQLQFGVVTDAKVQIRIRLGSDLFFQTGPYQNGAEIEVAGQPLVTQVKGCLAAAYLDADTFVVSCFQGECAFSLNFGSDFTPFSAGQRVKIDVASGEAAKPVSIPKPDAFKYWTLLNETSAGREDAQRCNVPPPPTPTREPTATREATPTTGPDATTAPDSSATPTAEATAIPTAESTATPTVEVPPTLAATDTPTIEATATLPP